eukprot:scaffold24187_cov162-Cylindrotheca_fusiformis.AAC.1
MMVAILLINRNGKLEQQPGGVVAYTDVNTWFCPPQSLVRSIRTVITMTLQPNERLYSVVQPYNFVYRSACSNQESSFCDCNALFGVSDDDDDEIYESNAKKNSIYYCEATKYIVLLVAAKKSKNL